MTRIFKTLAVLALSAICGPAAAQTSFGFDPTKTCDLSVHASGGAYVLDCTITIDHPNGPPMSGMGGPVQLGVVDVLTQNGQTIVDSGFGYDDTTGFTCADANVSMVSSNGMSPNQPPTLPGFGCSIASDQLSSATQTTLHLQSYVPIDTSGIVTNCAATTLHDPALPDAHQVGPQSCVNIDLDAYTAPPPEPIATDKSCEQPVVQADGSITVACFIGVDFPSGPPLDAADQVLPVSVFDTLTLNGAATTGSVVVGANDDPWVCNSGPFVAFQGATPQAANLVCGLDQNATYLAATSGAGGHGGSSTIRTITTFPKGSTGSAENCATVAYAPAAEQSLASEPSCVTIDLPKLHPVDPIKPVACEAFTTDVTCDAASGKPVVTLKSKRANIFKPSQVHFTSQTDGVTVTQSKANPMQVLLSGAAPGDTVLLMTDAVAQGKGSKPGLDLCCEGPIKVTIPKGFTCEAKAKLEVSKTCDTDVKSTVGANAECEITVHYEGPAPKASNPIVVTEAVTGSPWTFTTTPLSGDNWSCPAVPDATPFTCTISAASEPTANWSNWTSTIIVQMNAGDAFENCITAKTGGLQDKACWSTATPELTIAKTADQAQCMVGQPCTFTIAVTNTSTTSTYNGPISLGDQIATVSPPVLAGNGIFTAIAPPLCPVVDLNSGACSGLVNLAAGAVQNYSITWIPPGFVSGEDEKVVVTNCVDLAWQGSRNRRPHDDDDPKPLPTEDCAEVVVLPTDLDIVKTGPELCKPGQPCDYQVTISTINGFNGPVLLTDDAPAGFEITAITPMPVGCGMNLPANPLACVIPASLNAGESVTYTISITPNEFVMDNPSNGASNCAGLRSVSDGAEPADYSYSGDVVSDELANLWAYSSHIATSCAPVDWNVVTPPVDDKLYVKKVVVNNAPASVDGLIFPISATCTHSPDTAALDNLADGETKPFYIYVPGSTCTVTEGAIPTTNACGEGRVDTWTTSYAPAQTVALNPLGETVTVTNTLDCRPIDEPVVQQIIVTKEVINHAPGSVAGLGFPITSSCSPNTPVANNNITTNFGDGDAIIYGGATGDTCTISEGAISATNACGKGFNPVWSTSYAPAQTFTVGTAPTSVTVTNTLDCVPLVPPIDTGFYIKKVVVNNSKGSVDGMEFHINSSCQNTTQPPGFAYFSAGEVVLFHNFEPGMTCIVEEAPIVATNVCGEGMVDTWTTSYEPAQTVTLDPNGSTLTVTNTLDCKSVGEPAGPTITKVCEPLVEEDSPVLSYAMACTITLTVPEDLMAHVVIQDNFTPLAGASGGTVTHLNQMPDFWSCDGISCSGGPFEAGTYVLNTQVTGIQMKDGGSVSNCAAAAGVPTGTGMDESMGGVIGESCVTSTLDQSHVFVDPIKTDAPKLTVTKTSKLACDVNELSQTYECGFALTVTNSGADYAGPLVLGDAFEAGAVLSANGSGQGWSCTTSAGAISCINGNLSLPSGGTEIVDLTVTVNGLPEGGTFENCASIGVSDDPTQQAMIVQTALSLMGVDIGAVDGKIGKRTRAAVVDLQEQLGLAGTGEIDAALLEALGVPMAAGADQSCVTVDLPPMPRPRLICDKATTVNDGGACECRYKNMYQADDQSCGCVKGFNFVAGEGCIKRKVKDPVKDPVKPKGVKCDAKTTVLRDGICECREEGMVRKNATSCARQKVRQELKICPNGLPEIPGVGCLDVKIGGGGKKGDGGGGGTGEGGGGCQKKDLDGNCCGEPGAVESECR